MQVMKKQEAKKNILKLSLAIVAGFGLAACDVEKTQEGEMPEVDVDVTEGQLPKYDVDAPEVDVKMKEKDVTIKVPDVDVTLPKDDSATEVNEPGN